MTDLPERLIGLLEGDFVRIKGAEVAIEAEVVEHRRESVTSAADDSTQKYVIRLMPIGESATQLSADRFRVTVESDGPEAWAVGALMAERYDEDSLGYELTTRGELTDIEKLDYR